MFWGNLSFRSIFIHVTFLNSQWLTKCKIKPSQRLLRILDPQHVHICFWGWAKWSNFWTFRKIFLLSYGRSWHLFFLLFKKKKYLKGKVNRKWVFHVLCCVKSMYASRILCRKNSTKPVWKHLSVTLCCSGVTQRAMSFSSDIVLLLTKYCFAVGYSSAWFLPLFSEEAWRNFLLGMHEYGKVFTFFISALLKFHGNLDNALLCGLEHLSASAYDSQVRLFFPICSSLKRQVSQGKGSSTNMLLGNESFHLLETDFYLLYIFLFLCCFIGVLLDLLSMIYNWL